MKEHLKILAAITALVIGVLALPATAHTTDWFACDDPTPSTAGAVSSGRCTGHLHWSDKTDKMWIALPPGAVINEAGTHDAADPAHGDQTGYSVVDTDYLYDLCGSWDPNGRDGGTYNTYWVSSPNWTAYTPPTGWTKVGEYKTVAVVNGVTNNVPTHVVKNGTGAYAMDTNLPETLACSGTNTDMTIYTYGYANNNSSNPWLGKNPSTAGTHTVTAKATLTTGATHTDTDTVTIT